MSGEKALKKDSSNHPPRWTTMRKMTCLCWKVPKMEKKVSLSLVCGISKKTDLNSWFCSLFSIFVTSIIIFSDFGPLGGLLRAYWRPLGALALLWGPLRPHEWLKLHSYPHPGSGATASSIGQIRWFEEAAKTIVPKPKLMEDGTRAKMKKSVNVFVS